jgi:hypothetical protein
MKASKIGFIVTMIALASNALADEGRRSSGSRGLDGFNSQWVCRADARDGSGMFYLGMGWSRAEAYTNALESCNRQGRSCIIVCSQDMNW